jgi:hypothetical protein
MFEEPVRFFLDVVQQGSLGAGLRRGRPHLRETAAARHYGMPAASSTGDGWVRVDDARPYGRGGLLPMAVFLTKNAPGLRTSPVKRGYWVVRRVLGERIPPPPAQVPTCPPTSARPGR